MNYVGKCKEIIELDYGFQTKIVVQVRACGPMLGWK